MRAISVSSIKKFIHGGGTAELLAKEFAINGQFATEIYNEVVAGKQLGEAIILE